VIGIGLSAGKTTIQRATPWGTEHCMTRDEAEDLARRMAGKRISDWMTCMSLAAAYGILGHYELAITWASRAVMLDRNASTLFNLAFAYEMVGRFDKSFPLAQEALSLDLSNPFAGLLYAEGLLRKGNWLEGWPLYERYCWGEVWAELRDWRPEWRGPVSDVGSADIEVNVCATRGSFSGDIAGKRILILPPAQGCGDLIMLLRWCGELKKRGAYVIYTCSAMVEKLLEGHKWIDRLIVIGNSADSAETIILLDEFDCFASLMSLPARFGATPDTAPWDGPYIKAKYKIALARNGKPLVGLCSQAGETNDPRRIRSLSASQAERLLAVDSVEWIGLDYGRQPLIEDWNDTAALIDCLDLVISVDTGVMHLAGAMGKPTWVILPVRSDAKFFLDRSDSPLYPSLRLFRSRRETGMAGAVESVISALEGIGNREQGIGSAPRKLFPSSEGNGGTDSVPCNLSPVP
jgi:tetratricopeptide (TPR) repeat protein